MLLRLLKFAAIVIGVSLAFVVGLVAFSIAFPPTGKAEFGLPDTTSIVAIEIEPTHPYLAEYQRMLVLRSPGMEDVRQKLFPDTGGYARAQLYLLSDGRFALRCFFDAYIIDVKAHAISEERSESHDGTYLGAFDDVSHEWAFYKAAVSPEQSLKVEITK